MDYIVSNPKCNRLSLVSVISSIEFIILANVQLSQLQDALLGLDYLHRHHFVHGNIRGASSIHVF